MNGADGYFGHGNAREHVAANLEHAHGQGASQNGASWWTQFCKLNYWRHEEETVAGDECELYDGEGDRVTPLIEDSLASI
jgi:hypothetical protein